MLKSQTTAEPLYLGDLITGLFAALALRGVNVLSLKNRRVDIAMGRLQTDIDSIAAKEHLNIKFKIFPHPIHRDSSALNEALYQAAKRELVSYDNPEFLNLRLKIGPEDGSQLLKRLPGRPEIYMTFASKFLDYYYEYINEV